MSGAIWQVRKSRLWVSWALCGFSPRAPPPPLWARSVAIFPRAGVHLLRETSSKSLTLRNNIWMIIFPLAPTFPARDVCDQDEEGIILAASVSRLSPVCCVATDFFFFFPITKHFKQRESKESFPDWLVFVEGLEGSLGGASGRAGRAWYSALALGAPCLTQLSFWGYWGLALPWGPEEFWPRSWSPRSSQVSEVSGAFLCSFPLQRRERK